MPARKPMRISAARQLSPGPSHGRDLNSLAASEHASKELFLGLTARVYVGEAFPSWMGFLSAAGGPDAQGGHGATQPQHGRQGLQWPRPEEMEPQVSPAPGPQEGCSVADLATLGTAAARAQGPAEEGAIAVPGLGKKLGSWGHRSFPSRWRHLPPSPAARCFCRAVPLPGFMAGFKITPSMLCHRGEKRWGLAPFSSWLF